jgi:hypothetical protein
MRLRGYTVLDAKAFPSVIFHKDLIAKCDRTQISLRDSVMLARLVRRHQPVTQIHWIFGKVQWR